MRVCAGEPARGRGPLLASITARDFSLLIRDRKGFGSASIHFSVLTKLFDGERMAGGRLSSWLESLSPLPSSCHVL